MEVVLGLLMRYEACVTSNADTRRTHSGSQGAHIEEHSLLDIIVILVLVKEQISTERVFSF